MCVTCHCEHRLKVVNLDGIGRGKALQIDGGNVVSVMSSFLGIKT